jgi:hypothetical protein
MKFFTLDELLNSSNVIDSRDVIILKEKLILLDEEENKEELDNIENFLSEIMDYNSEVEYGTSIISDYYFEDYVKDYIEEIYPELENLPPFIKYNIDWGRVTNDLKVDYAYVETNNKKYWVSVN